jgi:hypothetical protein
MSPTTSSPGLSSLGLRAVLAAALSAPAFAQPDVYPILDFLSSRCLTPNQSFRIDWRVHNQGNWGTEFRWSDGIYLNNAPDRSGAILLHRHDWSVSICGGCTSLPQSANPVTPVVGYGHWYVGIYTNMFQSQGWPIPEVNYSNNGLWTQVVVDGPPDFAWHSLSGNPTRLVPGTRLTIQGRLANNAGTMGNAPIYADFYINRTPDLAGSPVRLIRHGPVNLGDRLGCFGPGAFVDIAETITVPSTIPLGNCFLVAEADPLVAVRETTRSNNIQSTPVFCDALPPDALVVDAANGPGADFTDLPPAVAAARDGFRIFVRAGDYTPVVTGKALTILGDADARVRVTAASGPFTVRGLPVGARFALQNLEFVPTSPPASVPLLVFEDNFGGVHCEGVDAELPSFAFATLPPAIAIRDCRAVTLLDCSAVGAPALDALRSAVVVTATALRGTDASLLGTTGFPAAAAVAIRGGELEFAFPQLRGGDGVTAPVAIAGAPALTCDQSGQVKIAGVGADRCEAGSDPLATGLPALRGANGRLSLDPDVTLAPRAPSAPHVGFGPTTVANQPALRVSTAAIGASFTATLAAAANDIYVVALSAPMLPVPVPGLGALWLDPATMVITGSGILPAAEIGRSIDVPLDVVLRGAVIAHQALTSTLVTNTLSNPAIHVIQ